ncbi:hypothetical protein PAPHI01_2220 [Pancytospora philotis]|nr:hypothetical protein PAPHI01_2220 [Pancytospora philotis]
MFSILLLAVGAASSTTGDPSVLGTCSQPAQGCKRYYIHRLMMSYARDLERIIESVLPWMAPRFERMGDLSERAQNSYDAKNFTSYLKAVADLSDDSFTQWVRDSVTPFIKSNYVSINAMFAVAYSYLDFIRDCLRTAGLSCGYVHAEIKENEKFAEMSAFRMYKELTEHNKSLKADSITAVGTLKELCKKVPPGSHELFAAADHSMVPVYANLVRCALQLNLHVHARVLEGIRVLGEIKGVYDKVKVSAATRPAEFASQIKSKLNVQMKELRVNCDEFRSIKNSPRLLNYLEALKTADNKGPQQLPSSAAAEGDLFTLVGDQADYADRDQQELDCMRRTILDYKKAGENPPGSTATGN